MDLQRTAAADETEHTEGLAAVTGPLERHPTNLSTRRSFGQPFG